jgi:hypothetical protein
MSVYRQWTIKFDRKRRSYTASRGGTTLGTEGATKAAIEREVDKFHAKLDRVLDDLMDEPNAGVGDGD